MKERMRHYEWAEVGVTCLAPVADSYSFLVRPKMGAAKKSAWCKDDGGAGYGEEACLLAFIRALEIERERAAKETKRYADDVAYWQTRFAVCVWRSDLETARLYQTILRDVSKRLDMVLAGAYPDIPPDDRISALQVWARDRINSMRNAVLAPSSNRRGGKPADKLYVVGPEGGPYKVGITGGTVEKRVRALQTGAARPLIVHRVFEHPQALALEKAAHRRLRDYNTSGEWFDAPLDVIVSVIGQGVSGSAELAA